MAWAARPCSASGLKARAAEAATTDIGFPRGCQHTPPTARGYELLRMANVPLAQLLRLPRFRIGITLIVCCMLNILAFAANSERLGGTAILGMADRGRYYVGSHGRYTEVTADQYRRNLMHDDICLASLPIVLLGGVLTISAIRSTDSSIPRAA